MRRHALRLGLLALLFFSLLPPAARANLEALFLDVGAADCALFVVDGEAMMIDTGRSRADFAHIGRLLEACGVTELDYLVLTHPHADHIGNAARLLRTYPVECALLPPVEHDTLLFDETIQALQEAETALWYPLVGETFSLGEAEVQVYGPHPVAYRSVNDWSIVCMIRYAGRSLLMTGDIEAEAEGDLLAFEAQYPLRADVLKVAHHGSDTSSTRPFLQAVAPRYAVVSAGVSSDAPYPHVETAMNLMAAGVEDIFTTPSLGDIRLSVDPSGLLHIGPLEAPVASGAD